jgi:hypothetical protein
MSADAQSRVSGLTSSQWCRNRWRHRAVGPQACDGMCSASTFRLPVGEDRDRVTAGLAPCSSNDVGCGESHDQARWYGPVSQDREDEPTYQLRRPSRRASFSDLESGRWPDAGIAWRWTLQRSAGAGPRCVFDEHFSFADVRSRRLPRAPAMLSPRGTPSATCAPRARIQCFSHPILRRGELDGHA